MACAALAVFSEGCFGGFTLPLRLNPLNDFLFFLLEAEFFLPNEFGLLLSSLVVSSFLMPFQESLLLEDAEISARDFSSGFTDG